MGTQKKGPRSEKVSPYDTTTPEVEALDHQMDTLNWRIWIIQVMMFTLGAVMLLATLIAASSEYTGIPCFYAAVVDYELFNATLDGGVWSGNRGGYSAPVLFLEPHSVVAFTYYTALTAMAMAVYTLITAAIIHRETKNQRVRQSSGVAWLVVDPTTLFWGLLSLWLLNAVVLLLAYKQIGVAATLYLGHFATSVIFTTYFCGRGKLDETNIKAVANLRQQSVFLYRLAGPTRAVFVNLMAALMAICILFVSLMLELVVANHLHTGLWSSVSVAMSTFSTLSVVYLIVSELILAHYIHVLIGPSLGTLVACATLGTAAHSYMDRLYDPISVQSPRLIPTTRGTLACLAVFSVVMLLLRLMRAYVYHRQKRSRFYGAVRRVPERVRGYIRKVKPAHRNSRRTNYPSQGYGYVYENDSTYETDREDELLYERSNSGWE
ncbi:ORF50 [Human alphaherpesvirus 3]|uniref:Envelope glycoprotein M n=4 Tax=Human herpesvirus 3 TaxID=10335 RepID=GM_VZVD|nr:envelope glycoprotein M [Human alphaherpesvirus 3]P09298.1 RecName: Full=Envelope glycoprotein M; Short=gM [Human herpesvirus 3 strain Dumas]Q77NP2.1 RecName: Full=Envelope glycoprotein M; Short=gM [Human herpesvirus 3 strain Oka vaccine]AAK19256.1 ORF50 [Human herpesvirus 3 VZV-32]AAF61651.1 ORF50 [Human alphaherpesvirus 3]AAT07731.1 virion membrane glycoprotein M [Human alphaherpesvirus 3]AAT07807.1 virion membrane glycoprotein M [Human alphaherpesvirus 3]AAY57659.1 ORF50 [Human alphahe